MTPKPARALLTLSAAALLAGCGSSDSDSGSGSEEPPAAASSAKVAIRDFKFVPDRVSVKAGAKVTFTNADSAPHTATMKPAFDTGVLREDESKAVTITKAGTYAYICDLHPYMKATIVAH